MNEAIKSLSQMGWWVSLIAVAVPVVWVAFRSRSLFTINHLLWRISYSGKRVSDPRLRAAMQQRANLMAFRATLMWADHVAEMSRLLEWAKSQDIDTGTLGECGRYFHRQSLQLKAKIPDLDRAKLGASFMAIPIVWLLGLSILCTTQSQVLLWFNDDHTAFFLSTDSAELVRGHGVSALTLKDCPKPQGWAGFNPTHTDILCNALRGNDLSIIVRRGVQNQRIIGVAGMALSLFAFFWLRRKLLAIRSAHILRQWLDFKKDEAVNRTSGS